MSGLTLTARGEWLGHETNHSPPSNGEVKNVWSNTSIPPYIFLVHHGLLGFEVV